MSALLAQMACHGDAERVVRALREIMVYVNRGHIEGDCSFCVAALEEGEQALAAYTAAYPTTNVTAQVPA